ncbi:hypothetical protein JOM56_014988 [Amanita muscaria]
MLSQACIEEHQRKQGGILSGAEGTSENQLEQDKDESVPFDGDFFGEYNEHDFDWPHDYDDEHVEELDDDDMWVDPAPAIRNLQVQDPTADNEVSRPEHRLSAPEEYKVEPFPSEQAGSPILFNSAIQSDFDSYGQLLDSDNEYAPFSTKIDWEIARWAKVHGPSSAAVTELLKIDGLVQKLALSYRNAQELNNVIDKQLPSRPQFQHYDVQVGGEVITMYARDIILCVQALYGDPSFTRSLILKPERHYKRLGNQWRRVFHDMHTGEWWWELQNILEARKPGATIAPLIISSDKTQITLFGNKTAYPVYLTIGNLPKSIRRKPSQRGQILLAYLPTSKLSSIAVQSSRRRMVVNLFHACLRRLVKPLDQIGIDGVLMKDGDGIMRRIHPILAVYVGDYPEQVLVTCTKTGECPKCDVARSDIGDPHALASLRNVRTVHSALSKVNCDPRDYVKACKDAGIKPVFHPFWEALPYTDIFQAITPDILHQIHQGVFKHVTGWLVQAYGASEIDARIRRIIPNHHIRIFANGISGLSRVTGKEHNLISRIILGVISDIHLPGGFNPARLVRAVRALLDFMFLVQLPVVSMSDLKSMGKALETFHVNKGILIDLGIREHFNIPKFHALTHYIRSIQLFGATDNYDTQYTERLHIDYTKDAYRATNTRDIYPQMTTWLERQEKIERHGKYIKWRSDIHHDNSHHSPLTPMPSPMSMRQIRMTRYPSIQTVSTDDLVTKYGATFFCDAFARFVVLLRNPQTSRACLEREALDVHIPFRTVSVYHHIRYVNIHNQEEALTGDTIHIKPQYKNKNGQIIPGRFDTGLVHCRAENESGIHAYRVAQVRVVFTIGPSALKHVFGDTQHLPLHLAYVPRP